MGLISVRAMLVLTSAAVIAGLLGDTAHGGDPSGSQIDRAVRKAVNVPQTVTTHIWTDATGGITIQAATTCTSSTASPFADAGWAWSYSSISCTADVIKVNMSLCLERGGAFPPLICASRIDNGRSGGITVFRENPPGPQLWMAYLNFCVTSNVNGSRCFASQAGPAFF